tara:strand:- start:10551 stop:11348 length:798 start_codon:yes stop_codon:yes gene_type:complete
LGVGMADDGGVFIGGEGIPEFIKGVGKDEATKNIVGDSSNSLKRISIRGSVFRCMQGNTELSKDERKFQYWVIVNGSGVQRSYYDKPYVHGSGDSPACWSSNNRTPDEDVEEPMAASCMHCPSNIRGSGSNNSRACKYYRRLAVVMADDIQGDIYQVILPSTTIFGTGENYKWPLDQYVKFLDGKKVPISTVVTEAKFDSDSGMPKLTFSPIRPLSEEEYGTISKRMKEENARHAVLFTLPKTTNDRVNTTTPNIIDFKQYTHGE